jgi:hypothetical protein
MLDSHNRSENEETLRYTDWHCALGETKRSPFVISGEATAALIPRGVDVVSVHVHTQYGVFSTSSAQWISHHPDIGLLDITNPDAYYCVLNDEITKL